MRRYDLALLCYRILCATLLAAVVCGITASVGRRWAITGRVAVFCCVGTLVGSVAVVALAGIASAHLFYAFLFPHIATGFVLTLFGVVALAARKGAALHDFAGVAYFWLMAATTVNVLILALIHLNPFGMFFSVATFYLLYSAFRFLPMANAPLRINEMDVALFGVGVVATFGLLGWVVVRLGGVYFARDWNEGIRALLFGGLTAAFLVHDARLLGRGATFSRVRQHLMRMVVTFVGAVSTASLVLMQKWVNREVAALWPYAVGIPLIFYFCRKFRAPGKSTLVLARGASASVP